MASSVLGNVGAYAGFKVAEVDAGQRSGPVLGA